MSFNGFIADEEAATPVIGIVLVVAITVVLAALIGTFVLDTGNEKASTVPQVSFAFDYEQGTTTMTATHESGVAIEDPGQVLEVKADGTTASIDAINDGGDGELNSGDTIDITLGGSLSEGDVVRIVYADPNTDATGVVGEYTAS